MSIILVIIGILGIVLNRKSVFTMLLGLELIIIGTILAWLNIENTENIYISIIIVVLGGLESLVGLALLVNYYKC